MCNFNCSGRILCIGNCLKWWTLAKTISTSSSTMHTDFTSWSSMIFTSFKHNNSLKINSKSKPKKENANNGWSSNRTKRKSYSSNSIQNMRRILVYRSNSKLKMGIDTRLELLLKFRRHKPKYHKFTSPWNKYSRAIHIILINFYPGSCPSTTLAIYPFVTRSFQQKFSNV